MKKLKIRGNITDWAAVVDLLPNRKRRIRHAPADPIASDPVNDLARSLHPGALHLVVSEVRDETASAKTFRLVPDTDAGTSALAFFRAGQYLSFRARVGDAWITRPYSIASSPLDALRDGIYEITVRRRDAGFLTPHIWSEWNVGTKLETSGPCGFFYHDSIRDTNDVVALGGGCGSTPFRSMIRDILDNDLNMHFTLIYGSRKPDDIIYRDELKALEAKAPDKIKVVFVCSEPDGAWSGPTGFLTADCITAHAGDPAGKTFFVCGPQEMYRFLDGELTPFHLPPRRIRREAFGEVADPAVFDGYPKDAAGQTFNLTVRIGDTETSIPAAGGETILVALERAGLAPPSQCRSGECGFCRSRIVSGDVFVMPDGDGRRAADRKFGWIHPCASWPVSDLVIHAVRAT